ncbi:hypothetical protein ACQUSR_12920 [Streptomyces sp. P1-3]|uniref:hypothetical protein n=1 Tax=Streptomyces sp. P1-3 TaxID=3421658 RepID=UPI003D35D90A
MSQNWQQPPQQPGGYGYPQQPQQPGYGQPQPQAPYGGGFPPPPPPAPQQGNAGLAIVLGIVAAVVGGFLYAFLMSAVADTDGEQPEITQFAYAGVALGALVGFVVAKFGGRNQGLWVLGAVLALVGVFFGELYGYAMVSSDWMSNIVDAAEKQGVPQEVIEKNLGSSEAPSAFKLFFEHFNTPLVDAPGANGLFDGWKEDADAMTWIFMALSPVAAFGVAKKVGERG